MVGKVQGGVLDHAATGRRCWA